MSVLRMQLNLKRWLERQLAGVRWSSLSLEEGRAKISLLLEEYGFEHGFLPVAPLEISPGFHAATVEIQFCDYRTCATVTVK